MLRSLTTCSVVKGTQGKAGNRLKFGLHLVHVFKEGIPPKAPPWIQAKQHSSVQAMEDDNSNFHFYRRDVPLTKFHNQAGTFSAYQANAQSGHAHSGITVKLEQNITHQGDLYHLLPDWGESRSVRTEPRSHCAQALGAAAWHSTAPKATAAGAASLPNSKPHRPLSICKWKGQRKIVLRELHQ